MSSHSSDKSQVAHSSALSGSAPKEGTLDIAHETLIAHLLASKHSLSSINHVWRANQIVTSAREALEQSVVLKAKNDFLERGIQDQVQLLQNVRDGVQQVSREGHAEFQRVLGDLDAAEARLQQTITRLRTTMVETSFRPAEEERKSLHDFLDEQGLDGLMISLRESIDYTNVVRKEFSMVNQAFEEDLQAVRSIVPFKATGSASREDLMSPVPSLLHSLESHAKEMADLLESLARHFDMCVIAVKYTEGGGAAVQSMKGDVPTGIGINKGHNDKISEPISNEEREDMLGILEKDAADVEDVVMEIRDRLVEMELQMEFVTSHINDVAHTHTLTTTAFEMLEEFRVKLPAYIIESRDFLTWWNYEKQLFEQRMVELDRLKDFYEGFLGAYDRLIIEVGRRKGVQTMMERIVQEAMTKIEQLHEDDMGEREAFRQDQGDFLPSDIWPGLVNPPIRYDIVPLNEGHGAVPDLPKKLIEQAMRRASGT
ncbi:MAG: autophagy protein 17 [Pycnora praestabilis]|nr:MAG: autophagy protein 17 [Pycnora praestabilis]